MRISLAATNPCHVWDLAVELHRLGALSVYYSGYPGWKLGAEKSFPLHTHSWRTLVTYGLHGRVPERFRPSNQRLFRWQDEGFDRWVARVLEPADFLHGIPGQCLHGFRRAKELGIATVLNHATGPALQVARILEPEYRRLGMEVSDRGGFSDEFLARVRSEFELADFHCCASSVVRDQLVAEGIREDRIAVVPYGADVAVWNPDSGTRARRAGDPFRILFAGQVSLRKGLRHLLRALEAAEGAETWSLDVAGPVMDETQRDRDAYRGAVPVRYHGPLSQAELAEWMQACDLLVLPSLEEGFGLVVVQAMACGLPCAVSNMVGAQDLIEEGVNGSVFPVGDAESLLRSLYHWEANPRRVSGAWGWERPAKKMLEEMIRLRGTATPGPEHPM